MKLARFGLVFVISSCAVSSFASPTILIFQSKINVKDKDKIDPNVDITADIAHQLDANGRLTPVIYSPTDPTIKAGLKSGKLKEFVANPKGNEVVDVAHRLRAEYIAVVESVRDGNLVKAKLRLIRDGRQIWKDEQNLSVSLKDILNPEDTARSIANTFVQRMNGNPLRSLPEHPREQNPTLQPGQAPVVAVTPARATTGTSDEDLKKEVDVLVKDNKSSEAILRMRDAVDAAPLDLDRRLTLIGLLQSTSPVSAADEARRAASLMPDKIELRVLAARAWMRAGQPSEAQKDLNEAIARDPNGAATRLLLGELSLGQLEPSKALGHLDEAIKQQDSGQARFLRAICRAMLGGVDGMQIDLAQCDKLEPARSQAVVTGRYVFATGITDLSLSQDGNDLRSLIPKLVVKPKDLGLHDQLDQMLRLVQARTALLAALAVPPESKLPQDQRILAYKLMAQSILDVQIFTTSNDEDTLAEARINLTEAMKQLASAKTKIGG